LCPVIEIFAIGNFMRAERIDEHVGLALVQKGVTLDFTPGGKVWRLTEICVGRYFSKPLFIRFRVVPMAKVETVTPIKSPICCQKGVEPTR